MDNNGPDMDQVEALVAKDESIKGMWCVPKYSNPTGCVYADDTVERLANMPAAAKDFRIFWDNAYAYHHLTDEYLEVKNLLAACKDAKNPERALMFGSTSKISFAGAGLAMLAASTANIAFIRKLMSFQSIGPDKLNQLRHVRFFKNMEGIKAHMKKHAKIMKPRFDTVQNILERDLAGLGVATWSQPKGGYFMSLDTPEGCAKKIVSMAATAGVKLTPAGNTFPYNKDPKDCNIRIAPTFTPLNDITFAMELVAICIKLAALDGC
jgi:DNA-binding transcriptional MocR family regulator